MFPVGLIASSGWASGLNVWAVAAALGIAGRQGWAEAPAFLQRPWVIALAVLMYAVEFVVDKIPYVDSAWDVVNTAIRPIGAATIAATMTADASGSKQMAAIAAASGAALTAHGAKASLRALINLSPEPISNVLASLTEDGLAFSIVALALARPKLALALTVLAVLGCLLLTWFAIRTLRRAGRRVRSAVRRRATT